MIDYPSDFINLSSSIPPAEEWIIGCLKMPTGDVWLMDRPASINLLSFLPGGAMILSCVESWGELSDGGTVDGFISPGNLECPTITITLIRADQTKTDIDPIIQAGIHNKKIELYRWFEGMVSPPVLIDVLFCQDPIVLKESSMLWRFDAVGCLCSENPYLTDRTNEYDVYPYLIGQAQGLRLQFLEEKSSGYGFLIGDENGEPIDESYTGLIRVGGLKNLSSGVHLINGEKINISTVSAGYMKIIERSVGGTEAQEHASGSRIFPENAVFKYAVCAGPVGSFEKLRTSNEIDIYDEDGDLDTTEYRDLYTGGNEEYHPELNPAQIWFNGRMPWLKKEQDYEITDKVFRGKVSGRSSFIYCKKSSEINRQDGTPSIQIPLRAFSSATSGDIDFQYTNLGLPSNQGAGTSFQASDTIKDGKFSVTQNHGEWQEGTAYTEFRATGEATVNESGYMTVGIEERPSNEQYYNYTGNLYPVVGFVEVYCHYMQIDIDILKIYKTGVESIWRRFSAVGGIGKTGTEYPSGWFFGLPSIDDMFLPADDARFRFKITVKDRKDSSSYAYVRIGGTVDGETSLYNMAIGWEYRKTEPREWISTTFGRDLSSRGVFTSAKARIQAIISNTVDYAQGAVIIYENDNEIQQLPISDGNEIDTVIELSATSWQELQSTEIKIEAHLTGLNGVITPDTVEINFLDGVQWLLTYVSNNLDSIQMNYTDTLYVDASSTRGANWTPVRALQYITGDNTSWAGDFLDDIDLETNHVEYTNVEHYLNGVIDGGMRLQDALREIFRQGFCRPLQSNGKLTIKSYLSDTPIITGSNRDVFLKSKEFEMTNTSQVIQKITCDYNLNHSTRKYNGQYELTSGDRIENYEIIKLNLVSSDIAVEAAVDWLFSFKSMQAEIYVFGGNFRLLHVQKSDIVNLPNFLKSDDGEDMITVSVRTVFGQGKNSKIPLLNIQCIKR